MRDRNPNEPPRDNRQPKAWGGSANGVRIRFELLEELTPGGSALAAVRIFDRVTNAYKTTEMQRTVYDAEGMYYGQPGDVGRAEWCPDARRWEIYELLGGNLPMIYGVLNEDLTAGGSAEITIHDAGGATAEIETVFDNLLEEGHYLPEGRLVWAVPHRADQRYYVIQTKGCALEVEE